MRTSIFVLGCAATVALAGEPYVAGKTTTARASGSSEYQGILREYCVTCHNTRLKTAGLALDALGAANQPTNADVWEKVLRKLQLGVMPPQGARRPDSHTYEKLIHSLATELDAAAATRSTPGRPVLRRLNRAEYANAIRDLLGLDIDVASLLPPDDAAYGFDNVADAQSNSPALL